MHCFPQLVMFEERKGVLKLQRKTTVLHGGEGKISTIKWQHLYIAWANDRVRLTTGPQTISLLN